MKKLLLQMVLGFAVVVSSLRADDITLSDGTVMKNAKIVTRDDSNKTVTIAFSGGSAVVHAEMLSTVSVPAAGSPMPATEAENWTVNGREYDHVKVGVVEADRVHITYDGGIGTVLLADLSRDLQKRFTYDPNAAKAMTEQRQQQAAQSDTTEHVAQAQQDKQTVEQQEVDSSHPCWIWAQVIQKLPGGVLVNASPTNIHCPKGVTPYVGGTFLLKNLPNEATLAEQDFIEHVCYPCGTYSYTGTDGASHTIHAYTAALPGN